MTSPKLFMSKSAIKFINIHINEHEPRRTYKTQTFRTKFFLGRCTLSPSFPSTLLYSHSWSLWVVCGISQKFSHFAEPLEPQALTKWAGGLPKPGLVGRYPVLPVSNWAGKRQNSFFHSISFSFWCWLYPKRQRDNERDRRRKSAESFYCWGKNLWVLRFGSSMGRVCKGWYLHTLFTCGKERGILFRASEKNLLVSHLPWKTNIETALFFFFFF